MKSEIRIVTNGLYAPHPCVMTRATFDETCAGLGWTDCEFSDAGPVIANEADVAEYAGACAAECLRQYREIV